MWKIFSLLLVLGLISLVPAAKADSPTAALSGFGWSDTIGWLDFSPALGGVTYNATSGNVSGYAWSDNIGWVSFEGSDVNNCPVGSCQPKIIQDPAFPADPKKGVLVGWARAVAGCTDNKWNGNNCTGGVSGNKAGGWDGWISLNCSNNDGCATSNYKVSVDHTSGDFSGYAWGSDVVGWLQFVSVEKTPVVPPTASLTATPAQVLQGGSSTLTWTSTDAVTCTSGDFATGGATANTNPGVSTGALTSPPASRSYTLSCTGPGGSAEDTETVAILYDFSLQKSNDVTATIVSGAAATTSPTTVTVSPLGGFVSTVDLSVSSITRDAEGTPLTGYTYSFSDSSLSSSEYAAGAVLTVTLPGTTQPGGYTIAVRGTSGDFTSVVSVKLNSGGVSPEFRER